MLEFRLIFELQLPRAAAHQQRRTRFLQTSHNRFAVRSAFEMRFDFRRVLLRQQAVHEVGQPFKRNTIVVGHRRSINR